MIQPTDRAEDPLYPPGMANNYRCYGTRRVHKQLRREGYVIARCTVARLMADMRICGVQRGRRRFTTVPDTAAARPPDLVERRLVAARPNELWLADTHRPRPSTPARRLRPATDTTRSVRGPELSGQGTSKILYLGFRTSRRAFNSI